MHNYNLGRFTSPDPYNIIFEKERGRNNREQYQIFTSYIIQPQIWNRYTYVLNNPLNYVDPTGLIYIKTSDGHLRYYDDDKFDEAAVRKQYGDFEVVANGTIYEVSNNGYGIFEPFRGQTVVLGPNGPEALDGNSAQNGALVVNVTAEDEIIDDPGFGVGKFIEGLPSEKTLVENYKFELQTYYINQHGLKQNVCIYRNCGPITNDTWHPLSRPFFVDETPDSFYAPGICQPGMIVEKQLQPYLYFFERPVRTHHNAVPFNPCWVNVR